MYRQRKEFGAFIHSEASLELYSTLTMPDEVFCEISLPFSSIKKDALLVE